MQAMTREMEKRIENLENIDDSSADEFDALIELQETLRLRMEVLRLKGKAPNKNKNKKSDLKQAEMQVKTVVENSHDSRPRTRTSI